MALVGCGTLDVERMERMPAFANSVAMSGGNSAWVMMASTAVAPAAVSALAQADQGAAGRDDIVNQQHRPARDRSRLGKADFDGAIAAANFLRNHMRQPELAREIAHPGPRLRVRTGHDGCGIDPGQRSAFAIAGMADRFSASMPGKPL